MSAVQKEGQVCRQGDNYSIFWEPACKPIQVNANNKYKIAFLADGYDNLDTYWKDISILMDQFRYSNLGQARVNKMDFYAVDKLNVKYGIDNTISDSAYTDAINTCGAGLFAIIGKPGICEDNVGGFATEKGVYLCNKIEGFSLYSNLLSHELGHLIAHLSDEYGGEDSIKGHFPDSAINCSEKYSGDKTIACPKWQDKAYSGSIGCLSGCGNGKDDNGYSDLYRPVDVSVMRGGSNNKTVCHDCDMNYYNFDPPSLGGWDRALNNVSN